MKPALAAAKLDGLGVVIGTDGERFKEAAVLAIDCVLFHGVCIIVCVLFIVSIQTLAPQESGFSGL